MSGPASQVTSTGRAPVVGSGQAAHSWEAYYAPELTWYLHFRNVLHHLPMFQAIRRLRPGRVLEVGAGSGSHGIFLSYFCPRVVSVDLSSSLVRQARRHNRRLRGRADFLAMDAFDLAYPADSFDVAFSQGFLEHFGEDEIRDLLNEQARVARFVVFSVPNISYGVQDFGDERLLSREQWEALLVGLGYQPLVSREYAPVRARFWRGGHDMYLAVLERRS